MPRRTTTLPRTLEDLCGRRCALWIRESTAGQLDNFGPQAQREHYEREVARLGLVHTRLEWAIAASGWTEAWRTQAWAEMMAAAAAGQFDVLVAGYASRFSRNLQQTLNAVNDQLHPAGVAVLFADERLLSSDPNDWDQFVREAHEAESYSRKLSKRVAEGYAAKRRRLGVPGGNRPPLGTSRSGRELSVDEEKLSLVRRAYELSAAGLTDRQVAAEVGLRLTHVREVLTNPFYVGKLRDGSPSALGALIEPAIWNKVQALRGRYSRRHRGSPRRRQYALSMLVSCEACGRRLTGHGGRYRHVDACEQFRAAAPRVYQKFARNLDHRTKGQSYRAEWYDDMVGAALGRVAASAKLMTDVMPKAVAAQPGVGDSFSLARIERDREVATTRYRRDRDIAALEAAMERLDTEERQSRERPVDAVTPESARYYLSNLWDLWRDTEAEGRRAIAEAAFDGIEAMGVSLTLHPSAEAQRYGWAEAFGPGLLEVALAGSISRYGRGERI